MLVGSNVALRHPELEAEDDHLAVVRRGGLAQALYGLCVVGFSHPCSFCIRQYWYFIVPAAPMTMARKARIEPTARVETPVTAAPIVQPIASTPPVPISATPSACAPKSFQPANHSMRNSRASTAQMAEPSITPASAATPKLTSERLRGSRSQRSVSPMGLMNV